MRKLLTVFCAFLCCVSALAQALPSAEDILQANMPSTLKAQWHRVQHSEMLTDNLESDGFVYLEKPDRLRWECVSPVKNLTVFNGETPSGSFRLPEAKDFRSNVLNYGDGYTVILVPLRRDLKQLFMQVTLDVEVGTLRIKSALIKSRNGDWSQIEFKNVQTDITLDDNLFDKDA